MKINPHFAVRPVFITHQRGRRLELGDEGRSIDNLAVGVRVDIKDIARVAPRIWRGAGGVRERDDRDILLASISILPASGRLIR